MGFYSVITYYISHKICLAGFIIKKKSPKATTKFKHNQNWCELDSTRALQPLAKTLPCSCSPTLVQVISFSSLPQHCGKMSFSKCYPEICTEQNKDRSPISDSIFIVSQNHNENWTSYRIRPLLCHIPKTACFTHKKYHMGFPENSCKRIFKALQIQVLHVQSLHMSTGI